MSLHIARHAGWIGKARYFFFDRYYNQTIRYGLIVVCMVLTLASAFMLRGVDNPNNALKSFLPVVPVLALAGFILMYLNIQYAPMVLLVVSLWFADGIEVANGTKMTFTFMLLLSWIGLWFFKMLLVDRKWAIRPSPANYLAGAFIVAVIISALWGAAFVDDRVAQLYNSKFFPRLMTTLVLILSPLATLFFATMVREYKTIRRMIWFYTICGGAFAFFWILGLQGLPLKWNARGQMPVWVAALALGQALYNNNLNRWQRMLLIIPVFGWGYVTLGLGLSWLSGWVPLSAVVLFMVFNRSKRLFALLAVIIALGVLANLHLLQANFAREDEESGGTRSSAWSTALEYTSKHYLFGMGPAGYAFYYALDNWPSNFSHNNYIDIFAQTGIVGLTIFVGFWLVMLLIAWKTYWIVPRGGFRHGLAMALLGMHVVVFIIMMLGDWITPFTYTQTMAAVDFTIWMWMFSGITIALYYEAKQSPEEISQVMLPITDADIGGYVIEEPPPLADDSAMQFMANYFKRVRGNVPPRSGLGR